MQTSGLASTQFEVIDKSALTPTGLKGLTGFVGITERGQVGVPTLVSSWPDYLNKFGGLISESDFPEYCKRTLEGGASLMVSRVGHYTNIMDASTLVGTKATLVKATTATAETKATGTITIGASPVAGDKIEVTVNTPFPVIIANSITIAAAPTATTVAAQVVSAINAGTSSHGYTAANTAGVVTVTAPTGSGALANAYTFAVAVTTVSTTAATVVNFASGVTAISTVALTFSAASVGAWGNSLYAYAKAAISGTANLFDVTIGLTGYNLDVILTDVPVNPTAPQIATYNSKLSGNGLATITSITTMGAFVSAAFTSGAEDKSLVNVVDYIGDSSNGTGFHAFDQNVDIWKLAVPSITIPILDIALAAYADARADIMVLFRTPLNSTGNQALQYRLGSALANNIAYSHAPVNSWRAMMFTGTLQVTDPTTGATKSFGETGDVAYLISNKDNNAKGPWFSFSGPKRGILKNVIGVVNNLRSTALKALADLVDINGINAIVNHETYGVASWGNGTLWRSNTLLKKAEVAELLIYLSRTLKPLVESETFDPNDIDTWKQIYRNVKPVLEQVKADRGVWDYLYEGDQDIDNISQATVNTTQNIDAGAYHFNLYIKPKVGMKYQLISCIVTNSGANFSDISTSL